MTFMNRIKRNMCPPAGDCVDAWSGAPVGHRRSVC